MEGKWTHYWCQTFLSLTPTLFVRNTEQIRQAPKTGLQPKSNPLQHLNQWTGCREAWGGGRLTLTGAWVPPLHVNVTHPMLDVWRSQDIATLASRSWDLHWGKAGHRLPYPPCPHSIFLSVASLSRAPPGQVLAHEAPSHFGLHNQSRISSPFLPPALPYYE